MDGRPGFGVSLSGAEQVSPAERTKTHMGWFRSGALRERGRPGAGVGSDHRLGAVKPSKSSLRKAFFATAPTGEANLSAFSEGSQVDLLEVIQP